jgi:hypothetical protein
VVNGSIRKYIDQVCVLTPKHTNQADHHHHHHHDAPTAAAAAAAAAVAASTAAGAHSSSSDLGVALTLLDLKPASAKVGDDYADQLLLLSRRRSRTLQQLHRPGSATFRGLSFSHGAGGRGGGGGGGGGGASRWAAAGSSSSSSGSHNTGGVGGAGVGGSSSSSSSRSTDAVGGIDFQDSNWRKHLSSLKPLGLSALVHSNPARVVVGGPGALTSSMPGTNRQYVACLRLACGSHRG